MEEKYYKPIINDDEYLVESTQTPGRVRGLSRDRDHNPGIPEWEEIVFDNEVPSGSSAEAITMLVGLGIGIGVVLQKYVVPWAKKEIGPRIRKLPFKKGDNTNLEASSAEIEVVNKIDAAFEECFCDMSEEELQAHIVKIMYHFLGLANEIQAISNSRIKMETESEELYLKKVDEVRKALSERIADNLNLFLVNNNMLLDERSSSELFELLGGGIAREGEYIPVGVDGINNAMLKMLPNIENVSA